MKYVATVAVMLTLGVPGVYAQERPVKMTFSGTNVATTINLRPGTITDEHQSAGHGSLGAFTFRELHADQGRGSAVSYVLRSSFSGCRWSGRISLPRRKSVERRDHGGRRVCQSHGWSGPPYCEVSDHGWNRAVRGCVRRAYDDGDADGGVAQRRWHAGTSNVYGGV